MRNVEISEKDFKMMTSFLESFSVDTEDYDDSDIVSEYIRFSKAQRESSAALSNRITMNSMMLEIILGLALDEIDADDLSSFGIEDMELPYTTMTEFEKKFDDSTKDFKKMVNEIKHVRRNNML